MIDVGIITAPRKVCYLGESLDSYFDQWLIKPHVFHEPNSPNYVNKSRVVIHQNEETLGCVRNWMHAARWMLDNTTNRFIMMCEDDIMWTPGAKQNIETLLKVLTGELINPMVQKLLQVNSIGFISPYCSTMNAPVSKRREVGWRPARYRSAGWCGALCMIFPRLSLQKLIGDEERFIKAATWTPDSLRRINKFTGPVFLDYAIGYIMVHCEKLQLVTHVPTLIQHLGEVSTFDVNNLSHNVGHKSRQPYLG